MVGREDASLCSLEERTLNMHRRLPPYRVPPYRLPGNRPGIANLVAACVLGYLVYRKGVEDGKKASENKKSE